MSLNTALVAEARRLAATSAGATELRRMVSQLASALEAAEARHADCDDPLPQVREWVAKQMTGERWTDGPAVRRWMEEGNRG